jgi:deazaflavin-dependent oxidoreductase (nitroreductase family)
MPFYPAVLPYVTPDAGHDGAFGLLGRTGVVAVRVARTSALVYVRDGRDYLLVASNGGSDRPPGWLFNIEANSSVAIQVGRMKTAATARVVQPMIPAIHGCGRRSTTTTTAGIARTRPRPAGRYRSWSSRQLPRGSDPRYRTSSRITTGIVRVVFVS